MQAQKTSLKTTRNLGEMEAKGNGIGAHFKRDLQSKLTDGLLAALFFSLLMVVVDIFVRPIVQQFGDPGLLVYTLTILAISVFTLERSLNTRLPETTRGWYGLVGGLLAWGVAVFSSKMSQSDLLSDANILVFILLALVVAALWKRVLPLGCKFFALALLLSWFGQYFQVKMVMFDRFLPALAGPFNWEGYLAILAVIAAFFWLFFYSERRIKRLWAALWICFFISILIFVGYGGLVI